MDVGTEALPKEPEGKDINTSTNLTLPNRDSLHTGPGPEFKKTTNLPTGKLVVALALMVGVISFVSYTATNHHKQIAGLTDNRSHAASLSVPPINHVVIIFQENHSFDNVLGKVCAEIASGQIQNHDACNGVTSGKTSTGQTIPLAKAKDLVAGVSHDVKSQQTAIDNGKMDGFNKIGGCNSPYYYCYTQYDPTQIPNEANLAETYALSDQTFTFTSTPSWAGHLNLVSATNDGFQGDIPTNHSNQRVGPGWGCDSKLDDQWSTSGQSPYTWQPSCVPDSSGKGPYRASSVPYVPTIFDLLSMNSKSWRIYGSPLGTPNAGYGYNWSICPTFYSCLGSSQKNNFVVDSQILNDAKAGQLPNFSVVTPTSNISQHNGNSMAMGDNWIGQVVGAIQNDSTDWPTTAIFIMHDDCGCFYDHVAPPQAGLGIRIPTVIVSPYAKRGYTDSTPATFVSAIVFAEHVLGLPSLNSLPPHTAQDICPQSNPGCLYGYDFSNAFTLTPNYTKNSFVNTQIPVDEQQYIDAHPGNPNDPT